MNPAEAAQSAEQARFADEEDLASPFDSGVFARDRFAVYHPDDTLAAAVLLTACSIRVDRPDDDAAAVASAVGSSALIAAAWLRARGAAVGHAASRARLLGPNASAYASAAATRVSRHSDKHALSFGATRSARIAAWLAPDRAAIVLVGGGWMGETEGPAHALVVAGAARGALVVFDPAGDGELEEVSYACLDRLRAEPAAAWEVVFAACRG